MEKRETIDNLHVCHDSSCSSRFDRLDFPGSSLTSRRCSKPVINTTILVRWCGLPFSRTACGCSCRTGACLIGANKVIDLAEVSFTLCSSCLEGFDFFLGPCHFVGMVCFTKRPRLNLWECQSSFRSLCIIHPRLRFLGFMGIHSWVKNVINEWRRASKNSIYAFPGM